MISDQRLNSYLDSVETRISMAYRPGTQRNQQHILFGYIALALTFRLDYLNPSVILLLVYIEHLVRTLKTASAVSSQFSSLRALMVRLRRCNDSFSDPYVASMLQSVGLHKRTVTFQRPPATTDVIAKILHVTDAQPYALQMRLAILIMFTTNMRQSNIFPATQRSFDPQRMLLRRDVIVNPGAVVITNKWSKAAQQVSSMRYQSVPRASSAKFCTWTAARRLFAAYPHRFKNQPLMHFDDFSPMTIHFVTARWKEALKAAGLDQALTLHSLRRGGASYLQNAGVPMPEVASHGGWRSSAILRYTRNPTERTTSQALQELA